MRDLIINQKPVKDFMNETWDTAVVGAGPAGSIAALHLASAGRKVILLDKNEFPREKVCGDGLVADAIRTLDRAGLEEEVLRWGHITHTSSMFSPSGIELEIPFDFVTIRRSILDTIIAEGARRRGAVFCSGNVVDFNTNSDGSVELMIEGVRQPLKAGTAVFATGVRLGLYKKHNLVKNTLPTFIAIRSYIKSSEKIERLIVSYDKSIAPGYAWIFPMGNGEYNAGCGIMYKDKLKNNTNLKKIFYNFCDNFPQMKRLMNGLQSITPLRGAPLRCPGEGAAPAGPGNTILIGETIGTTLPFSGEGIGKAMESGELAARIINESFKKSDFNNIKMFDEAFKKEMGYKYRGYQIAQNWLAYPRLNDFIIKRINKSKSLKNAVIGIVNESIDPASIFSLKGVANSLWR